MTRRVVVLCNALDDLTRTQRGITTDSPAASRKMFALCRALRNQGVDAEVLSLGRGRAGWRWGFHAAQSREVDGVIARYAPFATLRGVSEFLSLIYPMFAVLRLGLRSKRASHRIVLVYYNRLPAYLPALLVAWLLGIPNVLDLEDGEVDSRSRRLAGPMHRLVAHVFDLFCGRGALLACTALRQFTRIRRTLCYYGVADGAGPRPNWPEREIRILMGGTISSSTGSGTLAAAVHRLRSGSAMWLRDIEIHVTGTGDGMRELAELAGDGPPAIRMHGRLDDAQYRQLLANCDVGLALKPSSGHLANTTFPSKVMELASAGLLVVSTQISDVADVLGPGAMLLGSDETGSLVDVLQWIAQNKSEAGLRASQVAARVIENNSMVVAGARVRSFLFEEVEG